MAKDNEFILKFETADLRKQIELQGDDLVEQIQNAVRDVATAAYAHIVSKAQKDLNKTRADYLKGLKFETLQDDMYLIYLDGKFPNSIEDGWSGFPMKEHLLGSKKIVSVGSRAGEPWVQKSKEGKRFAHVPFEQKPYAKTQGASDVASLLMNLKVQNDKGKMQKMTSVFKDQGGNPIQGKVATYRTSAQDRAKGLSIKGLEGVTKYQKTYENPQTGKKTTQSIYLMFRTVSDKSPASAWYNKGFAGLHAFKEAEAIVERELDNILKTLMK